MTLIDEKLEREYNNRAAVPEHPRFLQSWREQSEAYRTTTNPILDVCYGNSARQHLDIFPAAKPRAPVHLFIHGGYWQALDSKSFSFAAEHLNRQGECAVIINYDLCPQVSIAEIIGQVRRALCWIIEHIDQYGGDPERIQVTGHSAGGHLLGALMSGDWHAENRPGLVDERGMSVLKRLNSLSGLFDLRPLIHTSINAVLLLNEQSAEACSPLLNQPNEMLIESELNLFVGEMESQSYHRQSSDLAKQWGSRVLVSECEIPATHHFSIVETFLTDFYKPIELLG